MLYSMQYQFVRIIKYNIILLLQTFFTLVRNQMCRKSKLKAKLAATVNLIKMCLTCIRKPNLQSSTSRSH